MSRDIRKAIRELQEEDVFSMEDDRAFFKDLRVALDKKEEMLQLCTTEGV